MRRWLHAFLLSATACSLEHPISQWDAAAAADSPLSADALDATKDDAPDVVTVDAVDAVAPDATDVVIADVVDAGAPGDVTDVPAPMDVTDVPAPQDVMDAPPATDVVDVPPATDVVDAPPAADVVDVPPAMDVVDVPAPQDVVDVAPPRDVPVTPDVPAPTFTQVSSDTQTLPRQGNFNGIGSGPALRCVAGEVLVGFAYVHGNYVDAIASRCAQLRANGTLGAVRQSVSWGGILGDRHTDDCPAGSVAVGLVGRADRAVNQLAIQCAPLSAWLPGRMVASTTPARGGSGGTAFTAPCPAGYVGYGVDLDSVGIDWGISVARLSLVCVRVNRQP